jgi:hypothetical protein
MPGFMTGIHALLQEMNERREKDVDGRDEPGHDAFLIVR